MRPKFKRFNNLKPEDINFDFHIHTNQTDGLSSPEEIVEKAISLKLKAIAFTEHVNKNSGWFDNFKKRIDALKKNKNIRIFLGIEAKANDFNGRLDATPDMVTKSDIVIGVVHRYPDGKGGLIPLNKIKNLGQDKAAETEFRLALGLLENKNIDILGHPFGVYSKFFKKFQQSYIEKLISESLICNTAIEINTYYVSLLGLLERKKFFALLKKINPYISIGSNAHHRDEIAYNFNILKKEIIQ